MDNSRANQLYLSAHQLLEAAVEESNRADEDKVTFLICQNTRKSILSNLQAFLIVNEYDGQVPDDITALIAACTIYDPRFGEIPHAKMACLGLNEEEAYCLFDEKSHSCLTTAKMVRQYTMNSPVL